MRLLHAPTLEFEEFYDDSTRPKYAILSHTWGEQEVTYKDMRKHRNQAKKKKGFEKITLTTKQTLKDNLEYFWIDTCCINKSSSAELSEAINSMFRWYRDSMICYAYLEDVSQPPSEISRDWLFDHFTKARWFTRGWTLQEMIAPRKLEFFACGWFPIRSEDPPLGWVLQERTGVPASLISSRPASLSKMSM